MGSPVDELAEVDDELAEVDEFDVEFDELEVEELSEFDMVDAGRVVASDVSFAPLVVGPVESVPVVVAPVVAGGVYSSGFGLKHPTMMKRRPMYFASMRADRSTATLNPNACDEPGGRSSSPSSRPPRRRGRPAEHRSERRRRA